MKQSILTMYRGFYKKSKGIEKRVKCNYKEEYELIKQKKSKLSARERMAVIKKVEGDKII